MQWKKKIRKEEEVEQVREWMEWSLREMEAVTKGPWKLSSGSSSQREKVGEKSGLFEGLGWGDYRGWDRGRLRRQCSEFCIFLGDEAAFTKDYEKENGFDFHRLPRTLVEYIFLQNLFPSSSL